MNPPAEVSTSLKVYQGHTLEKTYLGEDFFWAITPMAGDYVLFKFDKPVHVERLVPLLHGYYWILMLTLPWGNYQLDKGGLGKKISLAVPRG